MARWLFKSEPNTWSWKDQVKVGKKGQEWDGVRNFQARNNMQAMRKGDLGFFYHSGDEKQIVGIVRIVQEAHPDTTDKDGKWSCVDIAAAEPLHRPVTLDEIKHTEELSEMALVRNSRLSVQPVTDTEWDLVLKMSRPEA